MSGSSWILVAGNAVAASILFFASSAKLVAPQALSRSLLRLTGRPAMSSREVVRAIGVVEALIALGVLIEPIRMTASVLLGLLGLSFIALGVAGRVGKVDEPCGCFGAASQQPLGNQNIALGLVVGIVGAANLVPAHPWSENARAAAPILAAALLCLICIVTSRSAMRPAKSVSN
jgi:hypothetical protein